jgi:hypothetical protein
MLRAVRLPAQSENFWWTIDPLSGSLSRHEDKPVALFDDVPKKVKQALWVVDNPYRCDWSPSAVESNYQQSLVDSLSLMHSRLLKIGNRRFYFSRIYAGIKHPLFDTSREAFSAVSCLPAQAANREVLCLQRSLLVAKTSKSFYSNGVIFIGAMLGNFDMHAWIIESNSQPDHLDRGWINYLPLLAIFKS